MRGGLNWLLFKAFLTFIQTGFLCLFFFFTAQPKKQLFCDSVSVQLYSQNIHTSLLVPMLICQIAPPALFLSFCLIGLIGDRGGCCPERQAGRQADRRPLAESVRQSQSPSPVQLGFDRSLAAGIS